MKKMLTINKALYLLDAGRNEEAVQLLELFISDLDANDENDSVYVVKASTILADHYYQLLVKHEALHWCNHGLKQLEKFPDLEDRVGYEITRVKEIITELKIVGIE